MFHPRIKVLAAIIFVAVVNQCQAQQLKPYRTVDRYCKDCSEMIWGRSGFELKDIRNSEEEIEIRFTANGEHVSRSIAVIKGFTTDIMVLKRK